MAWRRSTGAGTPGDGSSFLGPEALSRSLNPLPQGSFYDSIIKVGKLRFGEREKANYVEVLVSCLLICHPTHTPILDIMPTHAVYAVSSPAQPCTSSLSG